MGNAGEEKKLEHSHLQGVQASGLGGGLPASVQMRETCIAATACCQSNR
jgi:hypothetical protein